MIRRGPAPLLDAEDDHSLRLRRDVTVIPFDDGLVVLDGTEGRLLAYDAAARALWERRGSAPAARALAARWAADGLTDAGPAPDEAGAAADRRGPATAHAGWADEWCCTVGGLAIRFAEQHPRGAAILRNLFAHLETPQVDAALHFTIEHPFRHEAVLFENGREIARTHDYGVILGALYQALLERLRPGTRWRALIHAGAAARHGQAIGLVGRSGSGKSTLLAALIARGFDYLADDLLAVSTEGRAVPWPMPLSIKEGSWPVLAPVYPELMTRPIYPTKGVEARLLMPPDECWRMPPLPLSALVFPTYAPGSALRLTRLSPLGALARLLEDRVWIGYPLDEASVRAFLLWLEATPCHALRHGGNGDAERALCRLTGQ